MRHSNKILIILAVLLVFSQVAVLAVDTTSGASQDSPETTPAPTPKPTPEPTTAPVQPETFDEDMGVSPTSPLYPMQLLIESISVTLTVDENDKAELMIKYANRRIGEALIMHEQDNYAIAAQLIDESLSLLSTAKDTLDEDDNGLPPTTEILTSITQSEDQVLISLKFMLYDGADPDELDELIEEAKEQIIITALKNVLLFADDEFKDTGDEFLSAIHDYLEALKSEDEDDIDEAYEKLMSIQELSDMLQDIYDDFDPFELLLDDDQDDIEVDTISGASEYDYDDDDDDDDDDCDDDYDDDDCDDDDYDDDYEDDDDEEDEEDDYEDDDDDEYDD